MVEQAAARAHARGLQVVGIGGITVDRAADVIRAGADSVAVISDLLTAGDPRARVHAYLDRLSGVGKV
jgi:thiamine-phosphate pyrophosphorylase